MTRCMWIAIALALGCGCERKKEDPGPTCEQVADHMNEISRKAYPGHGDMMPASSRKVYVAQCQSRKLTGKQRRCILDAQSIEAMAACMPREKPDEKKPGGARGMPAPPAPPAQPPPAAPEGAPPPQPPPAAPAPAPQ
jgi:hypothetical protein